MRGHSVRIHFQKGQRRLFAILLGCTLALALSVRAQTLAEALDTTNLVWTTGGDAPWFAQTTNTYDGVDAVRSGIIGSNETSWIETTVMGPATVSFWRTGSWFPDGSGLGFAFTINGSSLYTRFVLREPVGDHWDNQIYDLGAGTNVLLWSVTDYSGRAGQACLSLDAVTVAPPRPLSFTYPPYDETVFSGETAYLSAQAIGTPPLQYQWCKDGTNVLGATNYWFDIEQTTTNNSGVYSVIVSNSQGFVISSNALLTVLPPAAPFFASEPSSFTDYAGASRSLSTEVKGSPPFVFQWRKDGTNLPGTLSTSSWGWASIMLTELEQADAGSYSVAVSNEVGSVTSSNAVVTVLPPTAPFFAYQPSSITRYSGQYAYLWTSVLGSPPFAYQWRKDGVNVTGATNDILEFASARTNDSGAYSVVVSNALGFVVSSSALFTVLPPTAPFFTSEPQSRTSYSGESIYFQASVGGSPPFAYQWRKDGTNLVGQTGPWLFLANLVQADGGVYTLRVSNPVGSVESSNAVLTVLPPTAPFFTYQPANATAYPGSSADFGASVSGSPPFAYQWRKDGVELPGATANWLSLTNLTVADAGSYSLVVSNTLGSLDSSNAVLTVLPPAAPFFTSQPRDATGYTGQSIRLYAYVSGSPPFFYQWHKEGVSVPGATAGSLSLNNLTFADAGSYTLVVTNALGRIESSNAVLTVVQSLPPAFARQPRSLEVAEGVCTWLSVEAVGPPAPYCTWSEVGTNAVNPPTLPDGPWPPGPLPPLPPTPLTPIGSTDSTRLRFTAVTTNEAGVYRAAATNDLGGIVSRDALLTILPPLMNVGSWWQGASDVFVTNGRAILAQGAYGLAIVDINDPSAPTMLGGYNTPGTAVAVHVSGDLAFVADNAAGLQVFSVANSGNPVRLGGYDTPGYALDVVVRSNLAFVADGSAGLVVLDVSNPAQPTAVGRYTNNLYARSICLSSNFVCVGSSSSSQGVVLLDVSNPALPAEMGRLPTAAQALAARDSLVFVAASSGLKVFDASNPAQLSLIGSFSYYTNSSASLSVSDVRVVDELAYIVGTSGGQASLFVLDVRDPCDPAPVGYFALPEPVSRLSVDGNLVYVVGSESALQIIETPFDIRPVAPPQLSLSVHDGMKLQLHGRRGLHYDLEYADGLDGSPWQPLPMFLLTNETAVIEMPAPSGVRFFRARQVD